MKRSFFVLALALSLLLSTAYATENTSENASANVTEITPIIQPLDESFLVNAEDTSIPTAYVRDEEPAAISNPLLLYALLGVVGLVIIIVGTLVSTIIHKHHTGVEATKALIEEENLAQHVPYSGADSVLVHHPSIDEARQFILSLRQRGYPDSHIRDHFKEHGWNDEQIAVAMRH